MRPVRAVRAQVLSLRERDYVEAARALDLGRRDARVGLLPGGGRGVRRVVVARRPGAGQAVAGDAVLGEHEVEDGRHEVVADPAHRDAAALLAHGAGDVVEAGQLDLDGLVTKTYTLDGVNDGYDDMRAGLNIRGLIRY